MYNALLNFLTPPSDTELPTFTIIGVQSGTLALGDYTVTGDIVVLEGTSLTLTAGSIFRMEENVLWEIQGTLTAVGTAGNRITFQPAPSADHWHGIRFCKENTTATSTLTVNTSTNAISVSFGLNTDWPIRFTTTGTLPAPLEPNQRYYLLASSKLALRMGGAEIDITDSGSGTHTAHRLNPTNSSIRSADYQDTNTLQYCDFYDADKTNLPANYSLSYRQWERGGGLMTWETEDMVFDHLRFYRCGAEDRGGACYIQGLTSTSVAIDFSDWYFEDCFVDQELAAGFASSHGQASVTLSNFEFVGSVAPNTAATPFAAQASSDTVTLANYLGFALVEDLSIKDLQSTGTLPDGLSGSTNYFIRDVVSSYNDLVFTADDTTDVVTITTPGVLSFANNMAVFGLATSGTLPGGLSGSTTYYMRDVSGSTFKLSLSPGGGAVNITSTGTGSHNMDLAVSTFKLCTTPGGTAVAINDGGSGNHSCVPLEDYYCFDTSLTVSGFTFS